MEYLINNILQPSIKTLIIINITDNIIIKKFLTILIIYHLNIFDIYIDCKLISPK